MEPGLGGAYAFHRCDCSTVQAAKGGQAGVDREVLESAAVGDHGGNHDRAGSAPPFAASQFGSTETQFRPQVGQEGHRWFRIFNFNSVS